MDPSRDRSETPADDAFVFISYSTKDRAYVDRLVEHLARAGIRSWIDARTAHGHSWARSIRARLQAAAAVVVVMSPDSEASDWVEREITFALKQGKAVFPLLLSGEVFFTLHTTQAEHVLGGKMPSDCFLDEVRRALGTKSGDPETAGTGDDGDPPHPGGAGHDAVTGLLRRRAQPTRLATLAAAAAGLALVALLAWSFLDLLSPDDATPDSDAPEAITAWTPTTPRGSDPTGGTGTTDRPDSSESPTAVAPPSTSSEGACPVGGASEVLSYQTVVDLSADRSFSITSIDAMPDGRIAVAGNDGAVRIHDLDTNHWVIAHQGGGAVRAVLALSDGRIASGGDDMVVTVWSPDSEATAVTFDEPTGWILDIAELDDGRLLISTVDYEAWFWDPDAPDDSERLPFQVGRIAQAADGRLATTTLAGTVRVWAVEEPEAAIRYDGHTQQYVVLTWLPSGRIASVDASTNQVQVWDPDDLDTPPVIFDQHQPWKDVSAKVVALAALPDGSVVSAGPDGVRIWCPSDQPVERLYFDGVGANSLLVHDGWILNGDWNGSVLWWNPDRT